MDREQIISAVAEVSAAYVKDVLSKNPPNSYEVSEAKGGLERVTGLLPQWADSLLFSTVKVGKPKVIRARATYHDSMLVPEAGLFVAVQATLVYPGGTKRIFNAADVTGYHPHYIPDLSTDHFLGWRETEFLVAARPDLASFIASRASALSIPIADARRAAVSDAPRMVLAARAAKQEHSLVAEKLRPFLKDNPLAALPPGSLALILRTPWRELEKIVSFLKQNRALAGGVDEESMGYVMSLITAMDVMDS